MKIHDYGCWTRVTMPDQDDLWLQGHQTMDQIVKVVPNYIAGFHLTHHMRNGMTVHEYARRNLIDYDIFLHQWVKM